MEAPDLTVRSKTQTDERAERPHLSLVQTTEDTKSYWEPLVEAHAAAIESGADDPFFEMTQHYLSSATSPERAGRLLGTLLTSDSLGIRATGQDLAEGVLEMAEKKSRPIIKELFCDDEAGAAILELTRDYGSDDVSRLVLDAMRTHWWERRQGLVERLGELRAARPAE